METPAFEIGLARKDASLLYFIRVMLGFGNISQRESGKVSFYVTKREDILKLVEIFNGRILLHKRQAQFTKWVEGCNKYYDLSIELKPFLSTDEVTSYLQTSSWLAGFIDAEGSFMLWETKAVNKNSIYHRLTHAFELSQKHERVLLELISRILYPHAYANGKTYVYTKHKEIPSEGLRTCDRIVLNSVVSNVSSTQKFDFLMDYLSKHTLLSYKRYAYEVWLQAFFFRREGKDKTEAGFQLLVNHHSTLKVINKQTPRKK